MYERYQKEECSRNKQETSQSRALGECRLAPGKKKARRKPVTEPDVDGHFTENREEWQKELQRHSEEVYTDQEETKDVQEKRIEFFKQKGHQQFTKEGRNAEITVDLVLQARARMTDNKVSGPEDTVSSEMIKILPLVKDLHSYEMCPGPLYGSDGCSRLVEDL